MSPRSRLLLLGLTGLGLTAVAALAFGGLNLSGAIGPAARESAGGGPGATFDGRAEAAGDAGHGPRLAGSARPPPGVTHGPVLVRVLDPAGQPVAGLRVLADRGQDPAPDASGPPRLEVQDTDGLGLARFADLPYDGHASVAALARAQEGTRATEVVQSVSPPMRLVLRRTSSVGPADGADGQPPEGVPMLPDVPVLGRLFQGPGGGAGPQPDPRQDGTAHEVASARVESPEVTLTVERLLPFRLDVRLGGDGRSLQGTRWQVTPRLEWAEDAFGSPRVPVRPGREASIGVRVQAPPGVVARRDAWWETWIHPAAERLEAVYPVRPALDLVVVFPGEALPFREEDWQAEITVAGLRLEHPDLAFVGNGRLRARGGSHCVTEKVTLGGTLAGRWSVSGEALIGPDPRATVVVEARLTPLPTPTEARPDEAPDKSTPLTFTFTLGGTDGEIRIVGGTAEWVAVDPALPTAGSTAPPPPPPPGALRVRALAPTGAPAVGALVRIGERTATTDAEGLARFDGLTPGGVQVAVLGAGATGAAQAQVESGRTRTIDVQPGAGGTLEVELCDADGNAIPIGTVRVDQPSGLPWIDLSGGVQRLDPFTDARGRRTLEGVETGRVRVTGSYGTREVSVEVDLAEGQRLPVRLVLPVDRPAPPPEPGPPEPQPNPPEPGAPR